MNAPMAPAAPGLFWFAILSRPSVLPVKVIAPVSTAVKRVIYEACAGTARQRTAIAAKHIAVMAVTKTFDFRILLISIRRS